MLWKSENYKSQYYFITFNVGLGSLFLIAPAPCMCTAGLLTRYRHSMVSKSFCFVILYCRGPRSNRKTGSYALASFHPPLTLRRLQPGWVKATIWSTTPTIYCVTMQYERGRLYVVFCFFLPSHASSAHPMKLTDTRRGNKLTLLKLSLYQRLLSPKAVYSHSSAPPSCSCSCSPPPVFIFWALSLTAGSDYGCEKWGSHASNPPPPPPSSIPTAWLRTFSPYWCWAPSLPPSPRHPSASLCLSSAALSFCLSFLLFCHLNTVYQKRRR